MKTPVFIVLAAVVFVTGSTLAIMNSACKSGHHSWCAPVSGFQHHVKNGHS
jgi:hypothetical protein